MKQKIIRYIVMLFALGVFSYSAYELTLIYIESKESMDIYDEISNMFMTEVTTVEGETKGEPETDSAGVTINNVSNGVEFVWDYELMREYNPEAQGYIRQGIGEYIDNPIMQHSDNEYYLTHLANNTTSSIGSIFIDYRIEDGLEAKNCIVYGHNMGSRVDHIMFGSLNWYFYNSYYHKEHINFDVYVGWKHYRYYVFAVYKTPATNSDTYQYQFSDDESFMKYIDKCLEKSKYTFEYAGEIKPTDKIITLSTCTAEDEERMIVQCVRREEIMDVPNAPEEEESTTEEEAEVIQIGENN